MDTYTSKIDIGRLLTKCCSELITNIILGPAIFQQQKTELYRFKFVFNLKT